MIKVTNRICKRLEALHTVVDQIIRKTRFLKPCLITQKKLDSIKDSGVAREDSFPPEILLLLF